MAVDGVLPAVGIDDLFIIEGHIAAFRHIFVHCGEEPEGIVRAVGGMAGLLYVFRIVRGVLVACVVIILHQRKSGAVVHLGGEHEADLAQCHLRIGVDDALDVLHGVAVAVAVSLSAVDEAGGTGPGEGDEALVRVPDIDHVVEFFRRGLHREAV